MDRTGPQRARDEELRQFGKLQAYLLMAQEDQARAGNQPGLPPQPKLPRTRRLWDQPRPGDRARDGSRERAAAAGCGKATPYSDLPVPVKAPPPPKTQMEAPPQRVCVWCRRRSVPLPKESPPMPPREDTRHFFDDQPSLASTIPMDLEEDEPEPFRRRSKSDSWTFGSANGSCTVWPYNFNLLRRSYSDSCLWAVEWPPAFLEQRRLLRLYMHRLDLLSAQ